MSSVFVDLPESAHVAANELAFAVRDKHPVTPGHTLVVPRRIVSTWFDATVEEQHAIFALVDEVKAALDLAHGPDGYNVGFNAGVAAGQTVMHLHVHVIPRYRGDMDDPRGSPGSHDACAVSEHLHAAERASLRATLLTPGAGNGTARLRCRLR